LWLQACALNLWNPKQAAKNNGPPTVHVWCCKLVWAQTKAPLGWVPPGVGIVPRGLDHKGCVGGGTSHIAKSLWADFKPWANCSSCAPARHWAPTQQLAWQPSKALSRPPQLWHVPSGGCEGAMWALGSAKRALRSAQHAWPVFGRTLGCAQTGLQHHTSLTRRVSFRSMRYI
jgi:hypothetical protein